MRFRLHSLLQKTQVNSTLKLTMKRCAQFSLPQALREKAKMPPREYDEVLYVVSDLCIEHGRLAFLEGLKIGMLLMQEAIK